MIIGVVTFWYGKENYGMVLQCWALQQKLKQLGHVPYVIQFIPQIRRKGIVGLLSLIYHMVFSFLQTSPKDRARIKQRDFSTFIKNNIALSPRKYYSLKCLRSRYPLAECYLAGSDQIWAQPLSNINNRAFFLDFGDSDIKRIAYAPSFAMKEYPQEFKQELFMLLKRFDFVSCREYDGVKICAEGGIKAVKVVDPTLLLDKETYLSLLSNNLKQKQSIFIYSINIQEPEDIRWNELYVYAQSHSLSVVVTPSNGYIKGNEIFENVKYSYATVEGWLENIYTSQFVVTPSFHGIVFSIILERDFVYVPLKGKFEIGNNRVYDLLKDLGLENRIMKDNASYEEVLNNSIDWKEIRFRLSKLRLSSHNFLETSLQ